MRGRLTRADRLYRETAVLTNPSPAWTSLAVNLDMPIHTTVVFCAQRGRQSLQSTADRSIAWRRLKQAVTGGPDGESATDPPRFFESFGLFDRVRLVPVVTPALRCAGVVGDAQIRHQPCQAGGTCVWTRTSWIWIRPTPLKTI